MKKENFKRAAITAGLAATAIGIGTHTVKKHQLRKEAKRQTTVSKGTDGERQAYLIGGGLATMAVAVYLLQDGGFHGENIHISISSKVWKH